MTAADLIMENLKFLLVFFKDNDVAILNSLIVLGTVVCHTAYTFFAFHCPCSSGRNYLYGLAVIGAPALALFLMGIMMNRSTWSLLSECRLRKCQKLSGVAAFALLRTMMDRTIVAPLTWLIISFLRGDAYTCALSEFIDPRTLEGFPPGQGSEVMATFPCVESVPTVLQSFCAEIDRRLIYESQVEQDLHLSIFRTAERWKSANVNACVWTTCLVN